MAVKRRSELECFVIGLIWQIGPASPYELRRHMQSSPSTQWSASAGAIYPLVQRLQRAGLLSSEAKRDGKRRRREYRITSRGLAVLRAWIGPPIGVEAVTVAHDPLRSRARFLEALPEADRRAWFAAARAALDEVEKRVNAWAKEASTSRSARVMNKSGELDVNSRRAWLDDAANVMG
ncbi:MAG: PadR family transcriptional regulator [Phycisphaerales bacterium]|nr:PadR family transcriptional regulator [Phycisphaerales bacterium]